MTDHAQLSLLHDEDDPVGAPIDGLEYQDAFVTEHEESELLLNVDSAPWRTDLARRVQHYGWRYDYRARSVSPDQFLGELPPWLDTLGRTVAATAGMPTPDQVIVNEYQPGQGIAGHTDCIPCFGPVVAMVSLGSDVEMDFESPSGEVTPWLLQRRSLLVLGGDARSLWKHGIAKRRFDRQFGVQRQRRVSLTFRTVVVAS